MSLQGALAGLLLRGPAHGYELHAALEAELGPLWSVRASQVYLTLGRMTRDGLIRSRRVRQSSRPDRQILTLTASGRTLASSFLMDEGPAAEMVVRLCIARLSTPESFGAVLDAITEEQSAAVHRLRRLLPGSEAGFQEEALQLEIARREADLRWLAVVRDKADAVVDRPPARNMADTVIRLAR